MNANLPGMSSTIFDLHGRVALVTGGSKGIGKAIARGLAEAGADVVISSRHENELQAAADDIPRDSAQAWLHRGRHDAPRRRETPGRPRRAASARSTSS